MPKAFQIAKYMLKVIRIQTIGNSGHSQKGRNNYATWRRLKRQQHSKSEQHSKANSIRVTENLKDDNIFEWTTSKSLTCLCYNLRRLLAFFSNRDKKNLTADNIWKVDNIQLGTTFRTKVYSTFRSSDENCAHNGEVGIGCALVTFVSAGHEGQLTMRGR
jgi:hypothetical protein